VAAPIGCRRIGKMTEDCCQELFGDVLRQERLNRPASRLSMLSGEIVLKIYKYVEQFWKNCIETRGIFASVVMNVIFPDPTGVNCTNMPIRIGSADSVPDHMQEYLPLLAACPLNCDDWNKIGYLTIHEKIVEHDTKGNFINPWSNNSTKSEGGVGKFVVQTDGPSRPVSSDQYFYDHNLRVYYSYVGGVFMASNLSDKCRLWNCKVRNMDQGTLKEAGGEEQLRNVLGECQLLKSGELVWVTESTPVEYLPLKEGTQVQFFSLTMSPPKDHESCTPNPLMPEFELSSK